MALVQSLSKHIEDLTGGGQIAPGEQQNIDVSGAREQDLIARALLVVNAGVTPPAPTTRTVPLRAIIPFSDPSTEVDLDVSAQATDAEVAAAIAALQGSLTPTAVKTANYTAAANDLVPVDATSGTVAVTLPTTPADKTRIAVKKIDSSTNTVTINRGGSDVFNKTGGSTSLTLSLVNQAVTLQYKTSGGIWYVVSDDTPLSQLDARYGPQVTAAGNLGASRTDAMSATIVKWITGTLNSATHTATLTLAAGGRLRYFLTQDATGGRAFRLDDGSGPLAITLNTAANAVTVVDVTSPDGTNFYAEVVG